MMSPYDFSSFVQNVGEGEGRLNINRYRTLLKVVNIPIKFFVSHFLLLPPNRRVFRKHPKKKNEKKSVLVIYFLKRFFGSSQLIPSIYLFRSLLHQN